MRSTSSDRKQSIKEQTVRLLDQFLLGYVSAKDLIGAAAPMLIVSRNRRGRKNYIEKYLMEISGKAEKELTREYIFKMREMIKGEIVTSEKDRPKVFRRTLRKLLERFMYDEIDEAYYLSMLSDLMIDHHLEIQTEPKVKFFFDNIQTLFSKSNQANAQNETGASSSPVMEMTLGFYDNYFKGLWDE